MTIDENRAREVYRRIERETGILPPEGSAMKGAILRAMLAFATEAASPTPPAPLRADAGEVETDEAGEAMVCTGCSTTRTVAAIRRRSPTAFTCCPERKMVPVRAALTARQDAATDAGFPVAKSVRDSWDQHLGNVATPKPDASEGEALATQENNHAG